MPVSPSFRGMFLPPFYFGSVTRGNSPAFIAMLALRTVSCALVVWLSTYCLSSANLLIMQTIDPIIVISLCESILEDGELSVSELYALAEWLNANRAAWEEWPGNLLVAPLREIWADGKVTKTELREFGRLLVRIRKEWAKRQAETMTMRVADLVSDAAAHFDSSSPRLPTLPVTMGVKSHTQKGVVYDVDLSGPGCSCPDWTSRRRRLPVGHLGRCCKHIIDAYDRVVPPNGWTGWFGSFIEIGWVPHPEQEWVVIESRLGPILASSAPTGWSNVYAYDDGCYERFGYNIAEDRWSYGISPKGARHIRATIRAAAGF